jgi:hypothetical protein
MENINEIKAKRNKKGVNKGKKKKQIFNDTQWKIVTGLIGLGLVKYFL